MIARPRITGGPANDVALATLAEVLRYGYAFGCTPAPTSDDHAVELFAAFLVGHGRRPVRVVHR